VGFWQKLPVSKRGWFWRCAVALLAMAGAWTIGLALVPPFGSSAPLLLLTLAVIVAARYGGLTLGLTATLAGALIGRYCFLEPRYSFRMPALSDAAALALFCLAGAGIALLGDRLRRALDSRERKHAEQALRAAEDRLQFVLDASKTGYWETDPPTNAIRGSRQHGRVHGFDGPAPDWTYEKFLAQVLPEDRERVIRPHLGNPEVDFECRIALLDGSTPWIRVYAVLVPDPDGGPGRVAGIVQDVTPRKLAEEALHRQAEEEMRILRAMLAEAPVSLAMYDREMRYVEISKRWSAETNTPREELLGRCYWDMFPDIPQPWREFLNRGLAGEKASYKEAPYIDPDGKLHWLNAEIRPWGDRGVTTGGIILYIEDVTERREVEDALRRSEQLNREVIQGAKAGVAVYDREFRYQVWNPSMEELTGVPASAALGRNAFELFPHLREQHVDELLYRALAGETVRSADTFYKIPSTGRSGWVVGTYSPHAGSRGEIAGVIGVVYDITSRKRAEEEQRILAKLLQAFITEPTDELYGSALGVLLDAFHSELGVFGYIDENGNLVCPSMTRQVWDQCQMAGKSAVFPRETWGSSIWGEALRSGKSAFANRPSRVPEGHLPIHNCLSAPIVFDGRSIGVLTLANRPGGYCEADRTLLDTVAANLAPILEARLRQRLAEQQREILRGQLAQAQKIESIGRLAGGVAHDFNNQLTVINGYSAMALRALKADDPLRGQLLTILKAGEHAAGLTRQLLAFSRKQILQPKVLNLNDVVSGMRSMLGRLVREDVEIRYALSGAAASVSADPHQVEQVIVNLAINARDAMPNGGRLLIETAILERDEDSARSHPDAHPGRYAMLAVSDTGIGMDEATREHIFEPFFTTKPVGEGTGLGLSMVQGIVAQSGGYIEVSSTVGLGTTFRVYLPALAEDAAGSGKPPSPAATPGGGETILVIEDEASVRGFVSTVLEEYGYRALEAATADEALKILQMEGTKIQLVVTDVMMPHMSGTEFAARARKVWPDLKCVFMSGHSDDLVLRHGVTERGAAFIQKPFSPDELAKKLREVLGPRTVA